MRDEATSPILASMAIGLPFVPKEPETAYLWHFIRMSQLLKLETFVHHGIWLGRLDTFKDVLEGTLPQANLGLLQMMMPPDMADDTARLYEKAALRGYASCWHASDSDPSEEMWATKFGNKGKAIALRTSPDLFRAATERFLGANGPCYIGRIRYIDHAVDSVPEANTNEVAFVVQKQFEFQNEVRLYLHILSPEAYPVLTNAYLGQELPVARRAQPHEVLQYSNELVGNIPTELGNKLPEPCEGKVVILPISVRDYIEEVLVGPKVKDEQMKELMDLLEPAGLGNRVRRLQAKA